MTRSEEENKNRKVKERQKKSATPPSSSCESADPLIEMLKTNRIELELQNEQLRKAQAELGASHQRFRELYDFAPVAYFSLDKDARIMDVNLTGTRMLGAYRAKLINLDLRSFVVPEERSRFAAYINELAAGKPGRSCDLRITGSKNGFFHARINGRVITGGSGQPQLFITFTDITEQKRAETELARIRDELSERVRLRTAELSETVKALENEIDERKLMEEKLRRSQENLRQLSRKTMTMMESDRKTVAREIHDSLGGSLAAIKFHLEDTLLKYGENEAVVRALSKAVDYIQETIKDTKRISAGLRPTTLDDLGLQATVKWFCRQMAEYHPEIHFVTRIDIDESRIDEFQKIVIFRIVQEAMNNAVQHSEADTVWLNIILSGNWIGLEVKDNGCGFDTGRMFTEKHEAISGYGLTSIRERAEICGGTFVIESSPGAGTSIRVKLPAGYFAE